MNIISKQLIVNSFIEYAYEIWGYESFLREFDSISLSSIKGLFSSIYNLIKVKLFNFDSLGWHSELY